MATTQTRVVLLNGPPGAGKDLGAKRLGSALGAHRIAFADPVKLAVHAGLGLFTFRGAPCPPLAFEAEKDTCLPEFGGATPRSCYIHYAERHAKPLYGFDHFGRRFVQEMRKLPPGSLVVAPDCGDTVQCAPVIEAVGAPNVLLARLHRPGRTFAGDSRRHIALPGVRTLDLGNDAEGDPGPFLQALGAAVRDWMAGA